MTELLSGTFEPIWHFAKWLLRLPRWIRVSQQWAYWAEANLIVDPDFEERDG